MKQHIIFECETCGKQSENREEIMKCEAAHLGMFCSRGMFEPHIKNSNLKMPENFDEYNPKEYPHFHVFMLMHLAIPIDIAALESNANIIAGISEEDIKTVTPKDLFDMGVELGEGD